MTLIFTIVIIWKYHKNRIMSNEVMLQKEHNLHDIMGSI